MPNELQGNEPEKPEPPPLRAHPYCARKRRLFYIGRLPKLTPAEPKEVA